MAVAFRRHQLSVSYPHLACAVELSGDGEIFDSDDDSDLPSVRQILDSPKQVTKVIDLTRDNDSNSEGDDGNHTEVSWLSGPGCTTNVGVWQRTGRSGWSSDEREEFRDRYGVEGHE
jgi:hypothetical protein